MKKITTYLLLSLVSAFVLVGCQKKEEPPKMPDAPKVPDAPK